MWNSPPTRKGRRAPAKAAPLEALVIQALRQAAMAHRPPVRGAPARRAPGHRPHAEAATTAAARRLNRSAGILAASVLADSAVEHYRGSFHNKAMITPLLTAALSLATSIHGYSDKRGARHPVRHAIFGLAGLTGLIGSAVHVYNVRKRPGAFSWHNLFYGAPIGAPFAILLSGVLGYASEHVRDTHSSKPPRLFGRSAGRVLAALTSLGLLGTTAEAGLLHFRGAYQNPAMYLPVTIPPLTAALLAADAVLPASNTRPLSRVALRLTALLGLAGVGFHAYGVQRSMGGFRNARQNVLSGPPLPAPPSFSALALAGLAALSLLAEHPDE